MLTWAPALPHGEVKFPMGQSAYGDDERCLMARNGYGCFSFLFDILLTLITGGLWLIWIFVREMRRR